MIPPPDVSIDHPDRGDACEAALGPAFAAFCAAAEAAGWEPYEVNHAVVMFMVTRMTEQGETVPLHEDKAEAWRKRRN